MTTRRLSPSPPPVYHFSAPLSSRPGSRRICPSRFFASLACLRLVSSLVVILFCIAFFSDPPVVSLPTCPCRGAVSLFFPSVLATCPSRCRWRWRQHCPSRGWRTAATMPSDAPSSTTSARSSSISPRLGTSLCSTAVRLRPPRARSLEHNLFLACAGPRTSHNPPMSPPRSLTRTASLPLLSAFLRAFDDDPPL